MNRKAQLSGFSDLYWAGLIIIVLLIFWIFTWTTSTAAANQAIQPVNWEAGWIANSYAQQPIGETKLLDALASGVHDEEIYELLEVLIETTRTPKPSYLLVATVRDKELITCNINRLDRHRSVSCFLLLSGSEAAWGDSSINVQEHRRQQALTHVNKLLLDAPTPANLRAKTSSELGLGIVEHPSGAYIVVVTG